MATTLSKPAAPAPVSQPAVTAARPGGSVPARPAGATARPFLFDKANYRWMLLGIGLILLGFFLMAGGKSDNPHVFNDAVVYSFRRITLAPLLMLAGFALEVYAILKKPVPAVS